jgi:hypothetical protein
MGSLAPFSTELLIPPFSNAKVTEVYAKVRKGFLVQDTHERDCLWHQRS